MISNSSSDSSVMKLAVLVKKKDGPMKYAWSGWSSCDEFESGPDKKTKLYCAPAKKVKITFVDRPRGTFEIDTNGKKSVKDLFTGSKQQVGELAQWRTIAHCWQHNCNLFGFQSVLQHRKCPDTT
eukprot:Skav232999  [mRNA]  locus=scaffold387:325739:330905:- [translate_table: standard]